MSKRKLWPFKRRQAGLEQSRLYLVRWYSLGRRPPGWAETFAAAAREGWQKGLAQRGSSWADLIEAKATQTGAPSSSISSSH